MHSPPSSLQIFKVFGKVLDKLVGNVLDYGVYDRTCDTELLLGSFVSEVKKAILRMRAEYRSQELPEITFNSLPYRTAYLYEYAPANALAVEAVLNDDAEDHGLISSLFTSERSISLCCLGGGPGSEIVGVAKWIVRHQLDITQLEVLVTDKCQRWQRQWEPVRDTLNTNVLAGSAIPAKKPSLVVSGEFAEVDVIDPGSAQLSSLTRGFDLYVISYVVSHIYTDDGLSQFRKFMRSVIDAAPEGSKFLFIDRNEPEQEWNKSVTTLLDHPRIEISDTYFSSSNSPGDRQEEKKDLGVLYEHLGVDPRLSWNIFWMVSTKV